LGDDDHLPGSSHLRKTHPRFGTPHVAIALTSALTIASLFLPLDTLMDVSSIAAAAQYIGTCLALPFLRMRQQAPAGAFRLPFGPLIPILGALSALALSVAGGFGSLVVDFALLGLGLALKMSWTLYKRARA
jgi:amino acid transporter